MTALGAGSKPKPVFGRLVLSPDTKLSAAADARRRSRKYAVNAWCKQRDVVPGSR
jgi:hypothetical protein